MIRYQGVQSVADILYTSKISTIFALFHSVTEIVSQFHSSSSCSWFAFDI